MQRIDTNRLKTVKPIKPEIETDLLKIILFVTTKSILTKTNLIKDKTRIKKCHQSNWLKFLYIGITAKIPT